MPYLKVLSNREIQQHIEQTHLLWGQNTSVQDRFEKLKQRLKSASAQTFLMSGLVDSDGYLMASLKRYYFSLRIHGERVNCIGLGAVFTHPEYRSRGLAAQLIETVLAESKSEYACQAALLYSDIDVRYYEKLGFTALPALNWNMNVSQLPNTSAFSIRPATASDEPRLIQWYQNSVNRFPIYSDRTEGTWQLFRGINRIERDLILIDGTEEIGFLSLSSNREYNFLWIDEWFAPLKSEFQVWTTLRKIAEADGYSQVKGWRLPTYHLETIENFPRKSAVPMISILNRKHSLSPADLADSYFASPDHF